MFRQNFSPWVICASLMRASLLSVLMLVASPGCTEFAPRSDLDLGLLGDSPEVEQSELLPDEPAVGEDWRCRTDPQVLKLQPAQPNRAVRSLQVVGLADDDDISECRVRACTIRDPECLSPVTDWIPVDQNGWVDVPLSVGFDGYLEMVGPNYVPAMVFYGAPLTATTPPDPEPALMVDLETAISFDSLFLMREAFPTAGVVNLRVRDCQGDRSPGVEFNLEPSAVGWYYVNGIPVGTAEQTTESGVGGFSDVQSGIKVITATVVSTGVLVSPPKSVFVRGGWFTNLRFSPPLP